MTPRFQVFFLTRLPFRRTKSLGQLGFQPCILGSYISLYIYVYIYTHIRCKVHQPNSSTRHVPRACNHSLVRFISSRILLLWPSCRFPKHQIECWRCEEECNDTPCDHQSPSVLIHTPRNGIHTGIHVGAFLTDSKNVRKMFEKKNRPFRHFRHFQHVSLKSYIPRISQKKLHQTTSRLLGLWESYRGFRRTNAPRHVAFSSGYSIAIFIRHAFGKFVSSLSSLF